jgi:hypothetical protein
MVFRRYSLFEMRSSDSGTELASFECKPYGVGGEARADLRDGFSFASLEAGYGIQETGLKTGHYI